MNKRILKTIIVHAFTLAFLIAACNASMFGLQPFGFATHLAVLLAGGSPLASLYFVIASLLTGLSLPAFAVSCALGAAGALTNIAIRFLPGVRRKQLWRYICNTALQAVIYGLLIWVFGEPRLTVLLSVLLGVLGGGLVSFAAPLLASGNFVQPTSFQCAGLSMFCIIFFMGMEPVHIGVFSFSRLCFALFVLFMGKCRSGSGALIGGLLAGLGCACAAGDASVFAVCAAAALSASAFSSGARVLPALSLMLGWLMCAYFFSVMTDVLPWHMIALGAGGAAFVAVPKKAMTGIRNYFRPADKLTMAVAAAGMGRKLPERLVRTSEALGEMSMLLAEDSGLTSNPRLTDSMSASLLSVCAECERYARGCETASDMPSLAEDYLAGGSALKSNILSMPCTCGGRLLKKANEARETLSSAMDTGEREEKSSQSYARRLDSLRRLISKLAKNISEDYRYDASISEKLKRDLPECGIPCGGGLVTPELSGVVLVPQGTDPEKVEKGLSRSIGKVRVDRVDEVSPGWSAAAFSPAPRLDVVYAVAQTPKQGNKACGDSYSATMAGNRAMLSLCDGSGTGRGAARLSQATLTLIESHYRAGFDAADGVASVNSFLSSRAGEEFSALDVVSIDLRTGTADIIKSGSPSTYLIRGDSMTKIDGSALPVGALETASYALASKAVRAGDVVVLVTDGISDALPNLAEIIAAQSPVNVKRMADNILAAAVKQGVRDDMSVLVARLIERS